MYSWKLFALCTCLRFAASKWKQHFGLQSLHHPKKRWAVWWTRIENTFDTCTQILAHILQHTKHSKMSDERKKKFILKLIDMHFNSFDIRQFRVNVVAFFSTPFYDDWICVSLVEVNNWRLFFFVRDTQLTLLLITINARLILKFKFTFSSSSCSCWCIFFTFN